MKLDEEKLKDARRLQDIQKEMVRSFVKICESEHLNYYMLGGTMLGAVRHKGFIPWDDDVDFGMPRPDYEKFFAVANRYLPPNIKTATFTNTKDHPLYLDQLIDISKTVKIAWSKKSRVGHVWIDIFPLDGMPNHRFLRELHKYRLLYERMMFMMSLLDEAVVVDRPNRPWHERILIFLARTLNIEKRLSAEKRWHKLDRALKSVSYEKSNYVLNMMGAYKFKDLFPKTVFGNGRLYEFEGMMLNGPQDYETYLTQLYGDYMVPPPESEIGKHKVTLIEEKTATE